MATTNAVSKLEWAAYNRSVDRANAADLDHHKITKKMHDRVRLHMQAANGDVYVAINRAAAESPKELRPEALDDAIAAVLKARFSATTGLRIVK